LCAAHGQPWTAYKLDQTNQRKEVAAMAAKKSDPFDPISPETLTRINQEQAQANAQAACAHRLVLEKRVMDANDTIRELVYKLTLDQLREFAAAKAQVSFDVSWQQLQQQLAKG